MKFAFASLSLWLLTTTFALPAVQKHTPSKLRLRVAGSSNGPPPGSPPPNAGPPRKPSPTIITNPPPGGESPPAVSPHPIARPPTIASLKPLPPIISPNPGPPPPLQSDRAIPLNAGPPLPIESVGLKRRGGGNDWVGPGSLLDGEAGRGHFDGRGEGERPRKVVSTTSSSRAEVTEGRKGGEKGGGGWNGKPSVAVKSLEPTLTGKGGDKGQDPTFSLAPKPSPTGHGGDGGGNDKPAWGRDSKTRLPPLPRPTLTGGRGHRKPKHTHSPRPSPTGDFGKGKGNGWPGTIFPPVWNGTVPGFGKNETHGHSKNMTSYNGRNETHNGNGGGRNKMRVDGRAVLYG